MARIEQFVDKSVDLKTKIGKSELIFSDILQLLYENDSTFAEQLKSKRIIKVTTDEIGKGLGFASYVFRIDLYFDPNDTYSFVLKLPTVDCWENGRKPPKEEHENNIRIITQFQDTELNAYDFLKNIPELPVPKIFYGKRTDKTQQGFILMENMSKKGHTFDIFYSATKEQCYNLAKHVVTFQTYIECLPKDEWQGKFTINAHGKRSVEHIWRRRISDIQTYKHDKGLHSKVQKILDFDFCGLNRYATETMAKEMGCETLVHGDIWTCNLVIDCNDIVGILDWQTNPLFDIVRFVSNCLDADVRRGIENDLVDFYYEQMTEKLKRNGKHLRFTREQAQLLYDYATVQAVGLLCFSFVGKMNNDDQSNVQKLAKRLNDLFDDAIQLMDKYDLHEKFKLQ